MSTSGGIPPGAAAAPDGLVTVLLASAIQEDQAAMARIFSRSNWRLYNAGNLSGALRVLRECRVEVVICERDLPPGGSRAMWHEIAVSREPPLLIVSSRLADDRLWAEALNLGAYDVLAEPFDREEVTRVLSLAWLHWRDQYPNTARKMAMAGRR